MCKAEAMGQPVVALQQRPFGGHRQHAKDAAAIVVEQDHHQRLARLAEQGQAVEIVQGAQIADQQGGGLVTVLLD